MGKNKNISFNKNEDNMNLLIGELKHYISVSNSKAYIIDLRFGRWDSIDEKEIKSSSKNK